jgi:hypothetical protein
VRSLEGDFDGRSFDEEAERLVVRAGPKRAPRRRRVGGTEHAGRRAAVINGL